MIWTVILTFIVTSLTAIVVFTQFTSSNSDALAKQLRKENEMLKQKLQDMQNADRNRREQAAYNRGLYDARQTDTLYRNLLKKQSGVHEQFETMMDGEKGAKQ